MKLNLNTNIYNEFDKISSILGKNNVYLVGGIVRDSLLGRETKDLDIATSLNPEVVHSLFKDSLYFKKYGTTSFKENCISVTIASLRKEKAYLDYRHPTEIEFISDIYEDYKRRDFTINALYATSSLDIIDPSNEGLADLNSKKIKMIGLPQIRLKEDPLRIIRAYRFSLELGFFIDDSIKLFASENKELLHQLNPQKIREEISKIPSDLRNNLINDLSLDFVYNSSEK